MFLLCSVLISTTLSAIPYLLVYSIILEIFNREISYNKIKSLVFIAILFIILGVAARILSGIFSHILAFNILYKIRIDLIEHMSKLNMGFFKKNMTGKLKKIINEDVENWKISLHIRFRIYLQLLLLPSFSLVIMFYFNWSAFFYVLVIPYYLGILASNVGMFKKTW